jgi:alpha-D-xyloside xylohydrolase
MGPEMEYATQRPADTIELRVYPGAYGEFTLYEDANDGYEYEQGGFAMTKIIYNDKRHELQIGDTKGDFPGRLKKRVFNVVLVGDGLGTGEELTPAAQVTKKVVFLGHAMVVPLPAGWGGPQPAGAGGAVKPGAKPASH